MNQDHALEQLEQLAELLRPYTRVNETIYETVQRLIGAREYLSFEVRQPCSEPRVVPYGKNSTDDTD